MSKINLQKGFPPQSHGEWNHEHWDLRTKSTKLHEEFIGHARTDLRDCLLNLGIDDLNVCSMSSMTIRNVVLDRFVHSVVS